MLASVLLIAASTEAGPPTERLRAFFGDVNRALASALAAEDPDAHVETIYGLVSGLVDFRRAAELVLGPDWQARTPAEREEFAQLLAGLLERFYVSAAASKASLATGLDIRYLDERLDGEAATVETSIATKTGDDLRLDYRMVNRDGRWVVRDVVIDHVSVAENYRAQVQRLRRDWSYRELMTRVKARGEPLPRIEPPPAADTRPPVEPVSARTPPLQSLVTPPAPPTAAAVATPAPGPAAVYWIQIGAFRTPDAAGRLAARLRGEAVELSQEQESLMRVRVGPFADRAAALAKLFELRARGYAPIVVEGRP